MREALEARSGLSPEQIDTLCAFGQALIEKNKVMNLTAITEPQAVAELHFLDCIALLRAEDFSGKRVIDIGCGAGFPGVPLKIAEPSIELTLLDSLAKRMTWLREILPQLGVEAEVVTARAEEFVQTRREQAKPKPTAKQLAAVALLGGMIEQVYEYPIQDALHKAVVIRKIRPTPTKYPRAFAKIKKSPL